MDDPRKGKPSASAIEQRYLCPGSANAQAGLPKVVTDVSDDGDRIHAALAGDVEVLKTLSSDNLAVYEDMSRKAYESAERHGFDPNRFIAEKRLWFANEFSGQPDRVYLKDARGLVQDHKSGFLPVTKAPKNPQLATLAVLAIFNYGIAVVDVEIIPRFGQIKECASYDLDSASQALEFIRFIIAESEKLDAPRVAGDKQCRYCLAKTRCPEFQAFASTALAVNKTALPTIPADQLAAAIDRIPAANGLIAALKEEGKRRIAENDPEFTKLYELTEGRNVRTIADLVELFKRCQQIGVSDAAFTAACEIALGAVDKEGNGVGLKGLVHSATMLKGKALNDKVDGLLDGIVAETKTAGSLKRKEAA